MPARMRLARKTAVAACALLLAIGLAACNDKEPGIDEPAREGLALDLAGIDYNVFITRELNPAIPPDNAYYKGPATGKGQTLYGVFILACNNSSTGGARQTARDFEIVDNQGNRFRPSDLPPENDFAYRPGRLAPKECIPAPGSVAQLGPTGGAMLLFKLPLSNTENRPLELEVRGPFDEAEGKQGRLTFKLDI